MVPAPSGVLHAGRHPALRRRLRRAVFHHVRAMAASGTVGIILTDRQTDRHVSYTSITTVIYMMMIMINSTAILPTFFFYSCTCLPLNLLTLPLSLSCSVCYSL